MTDPKKVDMATLRGSLSKYVAQAEKGETLLIVRRGTVVAALGPVPKPGEPPAAVGAGVPLRPSAPSGRAEAQERDRRIRDLLNKASTKGRRDG